MMTSVRWEKGKTMTNTEAIKTLKANYPDICYTMLREAVDTAIEALKEQDKTGDVMRLIDANKLKDIISDTWILDRIDEQSTVDAVEVVRCKDCKYYDDEDSFCAYIIWAKPDGYCSGGERR